MKQLSSRSLVSLYIALFLEWSFRNSSFTGNHSRLIFFFCFWKFVGNLDMISELMNWCFISAPEFFLFPLDCFFTHSCNHHVQPFLLGQCWFFLFKCQKPPPKPASWENGTNWLFSWILQFRIRFKFSWVRTQPLSVTKPWFPGSICLVLTLFHVVAGW